MCLEGNDGSLCEDKMTKKQDEAALNFLASIAVGCFAGFFAFCVALLFLTIIKSIAIGGIFFCIAFLLILANIERLLK